MRLLNFLKGNTRYESFILTCWVFLIVVSLGKGFAGRLEGMYFPVTSQLEISSVEEVEFGSVIDGTFTKFRNCDFRDIDIKLKNGGNYVQLFSMTEVKESRNKGLHDIGKMFINTTPENIANDKTVGYIIHRCHNAYDTKTLFIGEE